jgi:hypothetical protein
MRLLFKLLAFLILAPIAMLLVLLLGIAAIVGLPMAWQNLVERLTAPPKRDEAQP